MKHSLRADVFLLTSLWEGLPISLLESMYMKKLCVVNDVIGNRDVIHNGENGFVCDDVDGFIEAIKSAERHEKYIEKYIEQAYDDVLKEYNTAVMADQYSNLYLAKFNAGGGYSIM